MISIRPLKRFMAENDITQMNMAEKTGITQKSISNMAKKDFTSTIVDKICAAYHCSITDVIEYVPDEVYAEQMKKEAEEKEARKEAAIKAKSEREARKAAKKSVSPEKEKADPILEKKEISKGDTRITAEERKAALDADDEKKKAWYDGLKNRSFSKLFDYLTDKNIPMSRLSSESSVSIVDIAKIRTGVIPEYDTVKKITGSLGCRLSDICTFDKE